MSPHPQPGGLRRVAVLRLRSWLVGLVVVALILALFVQRRRADECERSLRVRLAQALHEASAAKGLRWLYGDLGAAILAHPMRVEGLRAGGAEVERGDCGTPTGKVFDPVFGARVAGRLLDGANHGSINADDFSDPQTGLRFWRGSDSIDVLFSVGSAPHRDVWAIVRDAAGNVVHRGGPTCIDDARLDLFIREAGPDESGDDNGGILAR